VSHVRSARATGGSRPALPGFEHVRRFWEPSYKSWVAHVMAGEFYVTRADEVITTVLGSCVAVCVADLAAGVGGMNHFMLPFGVEKSGDATRYGCFAIERLLNEVYKNGGNRQSIEVKVFGGGKVVKGMGDVGKSNVDFIHDYLRAEELRISSEDVGGHWARKLRYSPITGKVLLKRLPIADAQRVAADEQEAARAIASKPIAGPIDLF
jgi:chemotaxis protein CheD